MLRNHAILPKLQSIAPLSHSTKAGKIYPLSTVITIDWTTFGAQAIQGSMGQVVAKVVHMSLSPDPAPFSVSSPSFPVHVDP